MNEQFWWHVSRSTGLVAWALLAASTMLGIFLSARLIKAKGVPAWSTSVHRFLGGLAVIFTGGHLGSLVADNYTHFGWKETLLPFGSEWKPGAVAWGVAAFWLLLCVELTSLLQKRMPRKVWRRIHALAFPLFVASAFHGMTAGTDAANIVFRGLNLAIILGATWLVFYRVMTARSLGAIKVDPQRTVIRRSLD